MKYQIKPSFARLLCELSEGEVNYSEFTDSQKKILKEFENDFQVEVYGRQQRKVVCTDFAALEIYVHNKYGITSLHEFAESEIQERSEAVKLTSNSKFKKTKVLKGFLVDCYTPVTCQLNGEKFVIHPRKGMHTFISDYREFIIPNEMTIVVVENHENFKETQRQKYLFKDIEPLFVWRYQNSNAIAEWINQSSNPLIHFGDFDPKGIHIYISEFLSKISVRHSCFLVPTNIEELIVSNGQRKLFEEQSSILDFLRSNCPPELQSLLSLILKHKKGLAQEVLIEGRQNTFDDGDRNI